jgi:putative ABC transport system permease protein
MTMQARLQQSLATPRMVAVLGGGFAALAALLAAVGVYGVIAFVVNSRVREFGVRLALGAQAGQLLRHVLGLGLRLALPGVALGIGLALLLGRGLGGLLYGVAAHDPRVLGAAVLLLGGVALIACLLPGLQASRLAPMQALRQQA